MITSDVDGSAARRCRCGWSNDSHHPGGPSLWVQHVRPVLFRNAGGLPTQPGSNCVKNRPRHLPYPGVDLVERLAPAAVMGMWSAGVRVGIVTGDETTGEQAVGGEVLQ